MYPINDFEHFVLQVGETLILRCKTHPDVEQLAKMREAIERALPGQPVLVLPPELEVFAGTLEVFGVDHGGGDEISHPTQEDIDAARKEIQDAYNDGRSVWLQDESTGTEWVVMHKHYNPIAEWDWDTTRYSLTKPKKSG